MKYLRILWNTFLLSNGLLFYALTGKSWQRTYLALINLFCLTNGWSSDWLSRRIAQLKPKSKITPNLSAFPKGLGEPIANITKHLNTHGYYVLKTPLSTEKIDALLALSTSMPCLARGQKEKTVFNRAAPQGTRYDFSEEDLINHPVAQSVMLDSTLAQIAQEYLGTTPCIDVVGMWWNTSWAKEPSSEAAQFFHFDMDRIKWLKVFVYLTDVSMETGPHTFVKGSHRAGAIPQEILKKGYARLSDQEVEEIYGKDNVLHYVAPRGTVIIEDTRGLHKGQHLISGDRLIFQVQFSNCLFGGYYKPAKLTATENLTSVQRKIVQHYL